MSESILRVRDLNVLFSKKQVLTGLNIDFHHQQITALVGPSGSGKTTLLRVLNRMIDLDPVAGVEGEVLFRGSNILSPKVNPLEIRQKIGLITRGSVVFQRSIFENIAYGLRINGWKDSGRIEQRVQECLRKVSLWDALRDTLDKPASLLDREQRQRLFLARALALEPDVLLIDEPTSDMDSGSTNRIELVLRELKSRLTVVVATHSLHQAARISDRTALLYQGKLVETAATGTLFTKPKMKLTEDYLTGRIIGDEE